MTPPVAALRDESNTALHAHACAQPLLVLRLRGSQRDMGAQHARLLRQHGGYEAVLDFYPRLPEMLLLGGANAHEHSLQLRAARTIKDVLLRRLERQRPAEYLARSRAFMEELGYPADHARFISVMDVFQNVVGVIGRLRLGPFASRASAAAVPACSTLMVWDDASADGRLRHARNFDFPGVGVWDLAPCVVFCEPDRGVRYGFVTARGADTPGVTAFNEAGLTVTAHTRFHRDITFRGAAVVDIGHDIVRRAETIDDAVAIAREHRVASTWGLAVSSAAEHRAVVIETTARDVRIVDPTADRGDHLTCANRYRHEATRAGQVETSSAWEAHSSGRQGRLRALVAEARGRGGMTLEDLEHALDDRVDPSAPDEPRGAGAIVAQPCTVKSIVSDPENHAVHVSVATAPTSRGPYQRVDWSWDGDADAWTLEPTITPAPSTAAERAHAHFVTATCLDRQSHDWRAALRELERAVELAPRDPSYRFLAGVLRLRTPNTTSALRHFSAGLDRERAPYRRAQLLLWGARAAEACDQTETARAWRDELLAMTGNQLSELRSAARADQTRRYDVRKRRIDINLLLVDAN